MDDKRGTYKEIYMRKELIVGSSGWITLSRRMMDDVFKE